MTDSSNSRNVRVLVVDDSPDVRRLVQLVIDRHNQGWQVIGAADDGQKAVEEARAAQPDLVLLDISMPRMDGLEALPLVHAAAPSAVVVMLTGFADDAMRASAEAAGAQGYFEKEDLVRTLVPRLEALLDTLHEHVAENGGTTATGRPPPSSA